MRGRWLVATAAVLLAGCVPPGGPGGGAPAPVRYRDHVAPPGGRIATHVYRRAPGVTGAPEELRADVYLPNERRRPGPLPALVVIHGGGFRFGDRRLSSVVDLAVDYARRGYATVSIDYRLDPGNDCQDVQDAPQAHDPARCVAAIHRATEDVTAAVQWVRTNARWLGVDPGRIALVGESAGAIAAVHAAATGNGLGPGGGPLVGAALALSGCLYEPQALDAADPPLAMAHADGDELVPYGCARDTVARSQRLGAPSTFQGWEGEDTHAWFLYLAHREAIDRQFTDLLMRALALPA